MRFSKINNTLINGDYYDQIKKEAYSIPGREACGILVGRITNDTAFIEQVRPIKNIAKTDDTFMMDPTEYLKAIEDTDWYTDTPKYQLLGIYHTHPNFPGYPSSMDWRVALQGQVLEGMYLIFTTIGDDLYSYYWDGQKFCVLRFSYETN